MRATSGVSPSPGDFHTREPGSDYTLHSVATTAMPLHQRPEAVALGTDNGYYLTAHHAPLWSGSLRPAAPLGIPPLTGTTLVEDPLSVVDVSGPSRIDSYTVLHERAGDAELGIVIGRLASRARLVANVVDRTTLGSLSPKMS